MVRLEDGTDYYSRRVAILSFGIGLSNLIDIMIWSFEYAQNKCFIRKHKEFESSKISKKKRKKVRVFVYAFDAELPEPMSISL